MLDFTNVSAEIQVMDEGWRFSKWKVFPRAEEEVYFYVPTLSKLLIEPVSDCLMVASQ